MEKVTTPVVRHISAEVVPMGPPPPPKPKQNKDSTFMEKLHAVDEELASSPVCMDSYQVLVRAALEQCGVKFVRRKVAFWCSLLLLLLCSALLLSLQIVSECPWCVERQLGELLIL